MTRFYIYADQKRHRFRIFMPEKVWWFVQYAGRTRARFNGGFDA